MSEPIVVKFDENVVAQRIGQMILGLWERDAKIAALEARVDQLDSPRRPRAPRAQEGDGA